MQNKVILPMMIIIFFPFLQYANAQSTQTDQANCEVMRVNQLYTPFRIQMTHDPAKTKTISDQKDHPETSSLTLEGTDTTKQGTIDAATHLAFSSNSTDNWTITVQLDYATEKTGPRIIIVDYYQDKSSQLLMSQTILSYGLHFCGIFVLHALPAPHIPTSDEILKIADKIQEAKFAEHDQVIIKASDDATASGHTSAFIGMLVFVAIVVVIFYARSERRQEREVLELQQETSAQIESTGSWLKAQGQGRNLETIVERKELKDQVEAILLQILEKVDKSLQNNVAMLAQWMGNSKQNVTTEEKQEIKKDSDIEKFKENEIKKIENISSEVKEKKESGMISTVIETIKTNVLGPVEKQENGETEDSEKSEIEIEQDEEELLIQQWVTEYDKPEYQGKLADLWNQKYETAKANPLNCDEYYQIMAIKYLTELWGGWLKP